VVATAADPADRRRTLVQATEVLAHKVTARKGTPATATLAAAIGTDDPAVVGEVEAALTLAAHRILGPSH
jgi:hypothetical protein